MFLNQQLLLGTEEFFDQILNENECEKLNEAISSLTSFLEKDVDGFTNHTEENLAYAVQSQLAQIWRLISKEQKNENSDLVAAYEDLLALTEDACGYEADDIENDLEADEE